jgi:hypothetical protein
MSTHCSDVTDDKTFPAAAPPYFSLVYIYYVLANLTVVYVFNFVDRQLLVILQEPIKAEPSLQS